MMSAGREVNANHLSAREEAERELERYPFPDKRQAVAFALVRFIVDDSCTVWPSALRLAHRAGVGHDTAQRALADFDRNGLTVRVEGTGDKGGSIVRRIDIKRLHELYPGNVGWNEFSVRALSRKPTKASKKVAACSGNFNGAEVAAPSGNLDSCTSIRAATKLPQIDGEVAAFGDESRRKPGPKLPHLNVEVAAGCGTRVLGLAEGFKTGIQGDLIAGHASPYARTDDDRAPSESEETTKALVNAFRAGHGDATGQNNVVEDCRYLAAAGATVGDIREALRVVRRKTKQPGSRPRWIAVRDSLKALLLNRKTVVDSYSHNCTLETVNAARGLEAVYARFFNRPSWTANRSRLDMATWLLRAVLHNVDETMFEAACRDARKQAKGKPPTWRHVRMALDLRIRARQRGEQRPSVEKPFFDSPANVAGTCAVLGNDTRH